MSVSLKNDRFRLIAGAVVTVFVVVATITLVLIVKSDTEIGEEIEGSWEVVETDEYIFGHSTDFESNEIFNGYSIAKTNESRTVANIYSIVEDESNEISFEEVNSDVCEDFANLTEEALTLGANEDQNISYSGGWRIVDLHGNVACDVSATISGDEVGELIYVRFLVVDDRFSDKSYTLSVIDSVEDEEAFNQLTNFILTFKTKDTMSDGSQNDSAPELMNADEIQNKQAVIKTDKGDIVIKLYDDVAPQTVNNFISLANEDFYDGLTFHRREEGFVLQGGDPAGNGSGGPGYRIPAEISDRSHKRGIVATARLGDAMNPEKESSGSQFYIVLEDSPFLDNEYTIFGEVTSGMDIVDQLQVGAVMNEVVIEDAK